MRSGSVADGAASLPSPSRRVSVRSTSSLITSMSDTCGGRRCACVGALVSMACAREEGERKRRRSVRMRRMREDRGGEGGGRAEEEKENEKKEEGG